MKKNIKIGDKFGTWTVIEPSSDTSKQYNYNYVCKCDCGEIKEFSKYNLLRNKQAICVKCLEKKYDEEKYNEFLKMIHNKGIVSITDDIDTDVEYILKCDAGHSFKTSFEKYNGCPVCRRKHIKEKRAKRNVKLANNGKNFANSYPFETEHWDYEKNNLEPKDVLPSSHQELWFICDCGESFSLRASDIKRGIWCQKCKTNRNESRLAEYTKILCERIFKGTVLEMPIDVTIDNKETTLYADIVIEELKLNIEVNGKQHYNFTPYFHNTKKEFFDSVKRDVAKRKWMEYNGYKQIVIDVTDDFDEDVKKINILIKSILGL